MRHQLCHVARLKNVYRVFRWLAPLHHKPLPIAGQSEETCGSLNESLLEGELSDGKPGSKTAMQVPKGFLAVYVGPELRRFVIPTSYLSMPDFRLLMDRTAAEFGFEQEGVLRIPCEEEDFEKILLACWANNKTKVKKV